MAFAVALLLMTAGASGQNLFVSNYGGNDIYQITPGGMQSVYVPGMDYPYSIAFDSSGDLFVANSAEDISPTAGYITEIMPNKTQNTFASGLDPTALAFNSAGDLFVADYLSGNIYEFSNGVQSTFATGFSTPMTLAFNGAGDLFVGGGYGNGNGYITEIAPAKTQTPVASGLSFPNELAFNGAGDLFEADNGSGNIYEFSNGVRSVFSTLSGINGIAFNSAGELFAASDSGSIVEINTNGVQSPFVSESGIPAVLAFQPVPEPSALGLIAAGAVIFFARYRAKKPDAGKN